MKLFLSNKSVKDTYQRVKAAGKKRQNRSQQQQQQQPSKNLEETPVINILGNDPLLELDDDSDSGDSFERNNSSEGSTPTLYVFESAKQAAAAASNNNNNGESTTHKLARHYKQSTSSTELTAALTYATTISEALSEDIGTAFQNTFGLFEPSPRTASDENEGGDASTSGGSSTKEGVSESFHATFAAFFDPFTSSSSTSEGEEQPSNNDYGERRTTLKGERTDPPAHKKVASSQSFVLPPSPNIRADLMNSDAVDEVLKDIQKVENDFQTIELHVHSSREKAEQQESRNDKSSSTSTRTVQDAIVDLSKENNREANNDKGSINNTKENHLQGALDFLESEDEDEKNHEDIEVSSVNSRISELKVKPVVHVALKVPKPKPSSSPPTSEDRIKDDSTNNQGTATATTTTTSPVNPPFPHAHSYLSRASTSDNWTHASREVSLLDLNVMENDNDSEDEEEGSVAESTQDGRSVDYFGGNELGTPAGSIYTMYSEFQDDDTIAVLTTAMQQMATCNMAIPTKEDFFPIPAEVGGDATSPSTPQNSAQEFFQYWFNCGN